MKTFPGVPGNDIDGYTLDGAKRMSVNCGQCSGHGLAPIYATDFDGSAVGSGFDRDGNVKAFAMRTVAYCTCPAGRKIMVNHQGNPNLKLLIPDVHDVIAGKHRGWTADDPTYDPNEAIDIKSLPEALRAMAEKLALPKPRRESA